MVIACCRIREIFNANISVRGTENEGHHLVKTDNRTVQGQEENSSILCDRKTFEMGLV